MGEKMKIKVTLEMTTDMGDAMIGVSGIEEKEGHPYMTEVYNVIYYMKKAMIAAVFGESQVLNAFRDSEEI